MPKDSQKVINSSLCVLTLQEWPGKVSLGCQEPGQSKWVPSSWGSQRLWWEDWPQPWSCGHGEQYQRHRWRRHLPAWWGRLGMSPLPQRWPWSSSQSCPHPYPPPQCGNEGSQGEWHFLWGSVWSMWYMWCAWILILYNHQVCVRVCVCVMRIIELSMETMTLFNAHLEQDRHRQPLPLDQHSHWERSHPCTCHRKYNSKLVSYAISSLACQTLPPLTKGLASQTLPLVWSIRLYYVVFCVEYSLPVAEGSSSSEELLGRLLSCLPPTQRLCYGRQNHLRVQKDNNTTGTVASSCLIGNLSLLRYCKILGWLFAFGID